MARLPESRRSAPRHGDPVRSAQHSQLKDVVRVLVLTKRQYMAKDLLDDRFGRYRELPLELARRGHEVRGICLSYRARTAGRFDDAAVDGKAAVAWLAVNLKDIDAYLKHAGKWMKDFRPDVVWAGSAAFHVFICRRRQSGGRVARRKFEGYRRLS